MSAHLRLVTGGAGTAVTPPVQPLGECLEFPGATGPGLTTFCYTIASGDSVVVTVPTALCSESVRGAVWGVFELAEACLP